MKQCPKNHLCLHVENEVDPICYCPLGFFKHDRECIDLRKPLFKEQDNLYNAIKPFILQRFGCEQDYTIDKNNEIKCSCLSGYEMNDNTNNTRCVRKFNPTDCSCSDNQICIQIGEKSKCICKPGEY